VSSELFLFYAIKRIAVKGDKRKIAKSKEELFSTKHSTLKWNLISSVECLSA